MKKKGSHPLKPDRPLASIVFSDQGRVSRNIEHLPRTQKDLELAVGKKFLRSLQHFRGIRLTDLEAEEGLGDFLALTEDRTQVLVQITEAVNQLLREINEQRASYSAGLMVEHAEVVRRFSGCRLTIGDRGSEPLLLKMNSKMGQTHLSEIAARLDGLANNITTLGVGKIRFRKYMIEPAGVEISVLCERIATEESGIPTQMSWGGGYVPNGDYRRMILAECMRAKITAGYSKPIGEY